MEITSSFLSTRTEHMNISSRWDWIVLLLDSLASCSLLLRAQIVPDPKKLKQELQALQEAVAHEKENVRQVEASGCEASRQLEASERAEREVEAALHGQARTPQPPQHPPTMHSPWP